MHALARREVKETISVFRNYRSGLWLAETEEPARENLADLGDPLPRRHQVGLQSIRHRTVHGRTVAKIGLDYRKHKQTEVLAVHARRRR